MDDAEIEVGSRNATPNHAPDAPPDVDSAALVHNTLPAVDESAIKVKPEDEAPSRTDDEGGVTDRPAKRRKLEDLTPRRSTSRAISPPWKPFAADGPTTIIDNGIRKSGRVNREPEPEPDSAKRSTRRTAKPAQLN